MDGILHEIIFYDSLLSASDRAYVDSNMTMHVTPEPSRAFLLLFGLAALLGQRRRLAK